jgi:hypothetical protein
VLPLLVVVDLLVLHLRTIRDPRRHRRARRGATALGPRFEARWQQPWLCCPCSCDGGGVTTPSSSDSDDGDARKVVGEGPRMVGPSPGGKPPSSPNLKETGGIRRFTVALQDAAARHSSLFLPSRDPMASPVRMVSSR